MLSSFTRQLKRYALARFVQILLMRTLYVLLVLSVCSIHYAHAQGCSDAGFCTAGVMQGGHTVADSIKGESSWGASLSFGSGEKQTAIIVPQIEGTLAISKRTVVEAKLPLNIASGKLGNHTGIGDFIATFSRSLSVKQSKWQWQGSLGARVGLGDASATDRSVVLPMPYQASLGTTDLIAGVKRCLSPASHCSNWLPAAIAAVQ